MKLYTRDVFTEFEFVNKPWTKFIYGIQIAFSFMIFASMLGCVLSAKVGLWCVFGTSCAIFLLIKLQELRREMFYFNHSDKIEKKMKQTAKNCEEEEAQNKTSFTEFSDNLKTKAEERGIKIQTHKKSDLDMSSPQQGLSKKSIDKIFKTS